MKSLLRIVSITLSLSALAKPSNNEALIPLQALKEALPSTLFFGQDELGKTCRVFISHDFMPEQSLNYTVPNIHVTVDHGSVKEGFGKLEFFAYGTTTSPIPKARIVEWSALRTEVEVQVTLPLLAYGRYARDKSGHIVEFATEKDMERTYSGNYRILSRPIQRLIRIVVLKDNNGKPQAVKMWGAGGVLIDSRGTLYAPGGPSIYCKNLVEEVSDTPSLPPELERRVEEKVTGEIIHPEGDEKAGPKNEDLH